jgi:hypothetical protein
VAEHTTAKLAPEVYVTPVSYRVTIMPEKCLRGSLNELRHWILRVKHADYRTGSDGWLVTDGGSALGRDGTWDYPSVPHPDDSAGAERQAWRDNYWHSALDDALAAAREHAPKFRINGLTATEVLARHRERGEECCRG